MQYHLGVCKNYVYGGRAGTLYLEARRSVDSLSCETWLYLGERVTTKVKLHQNRSAILALINKQEHTQYERLVVV